MYLLNYIELQLTRHNPQKHPSKYTFTYTNTYTSTYTSIYIHSLQDKGNIFCNLQCFTFTQHKNCALCTGPCVIYLILCLCE